MRELGEYKHIFLRVSASGEVDCKSANLQVNRDKTIKIVVEDVRYVGFSSLAES